MTYHLTERALLALVYRAEADADLEGDVKFHNLVIDNPGTKDADFSWDNPQWLEVGLRYRLTTGNHLFLSAGWQDWSAFGEKNEVSLDGHVTTLDRKWDDTWHAGVAFSHQSGRGHGYSVGFTYESSPVEDKYRTYDFPVDEIYKFSASYFWEGNRNFDFFTWLNPVSGRPCRHRCDCPGSAVDRQVRQELRPVSRRDGTLQVLEPGAYLVS